MTLKVTVTVNKPQTNRKKMNANENRINMMLAQDPTKIDNKVLRAAVEQVQKENEQRQIREAIANLQLVQNHTARAVEALRNARKAEASAKKYLVAVDAAQQQFMKDGDKMAYDKAVYLALIAK
jgi:hypothetical protein